MPSKTLWHNFAKTKSEHFQKRCYNMGPKSLYLCPGQKRSLEDQVTEILSPFLACQEQVFLLCLVLVSSGQKRLSFEILSINHMIYWISNF